MLFSWSCNHDYHRKQSRERATQWGTNIEQTNLENSYAPVDPYPVKAETNIHRHEDTNSPHGRKILCRPIVVFFHFESFGSPAHADMFLQIFVVFVPILVRIQEVDLGKK